MLIEYKTGDLLTSGEPAIAHGCNTQGVMGAGIANAIKHRWPGNYQQYNYGCQKRLLVIGNVFTYANDDPVIFNLMTQEETGANAKLWAIQRTVGEMLAQCRRAEITRVGLPQIGCGIGGLQWPHVEGILEAHQEMFPDVQMVIYTLDGFYRVSVGSPLYGIQVRSTPRRGL